MSLQRLLLLLLIILLGLSVLLIPPLSRALTLSNPQSPISSPPPLARAFSSPTGAATVWLAPDPQPELWLAAPGEMPRLLLAGKLEHFSTPRWSPDGRRAAVFAAPTGTETAPLGRWWVIDVDGVREARQVASTPDWVNVSPLLPRSPAPLLPRSPAPPLPSVYPFLSAASRPAALPPATIRVAHHPDNSCRDLPAWAVTVIPFEEYVARVVPREVPALWPEAVLRAQAIAARTFAWRKVLLAPPTATYDVTDWTVDQVMCDTTHPRTDAATAATAGRYLDYDGQVILAQYSAENGSPTLDGGLPYLRPVMDPVSLGRARRGHGHGMSQWGAYRWAAWHGWNAVQILTHYYTAARVIDPAGADPHLSLLTPWPGTWLTGAQAHLTAHATFPPTTTVTMTFQAPGLTAQDAEPADGWSAEWLLPEALPGPITITAGTGTLTHTLTLAGEDRLPPVAQLDLPTGAPALTITLHISATDPGLSGLAGVAVGGDWQARAADFVRQTGAGSLVPDPDAQSGSVLVLPAGTASRWQATSPQALVTDRIYQAYARLRIADYGLRIEPELYNPQSPIPNPQMARIELYDPATSALLGFADLRAGDFRQAGTYQEFPLDFWLAPGASGRLGVRFEISGSRFRILERSICNLQSAICNSWVALDRVRILKQPQPYQTELLYGLERRAGPQTVVVKVLDAAGNPSADLIGTTQLLDTTPPGDWQLLAPAGWVTTTLRPLVRASVADDLTGIAPESAAARFTTDGGMSWSVWQPVSVTVGPGLAAELALAWPGGEGGGANRVQFRVADGVGWSSASPGWPVRVDTRPPAATLTAPRLAAAGVPFTVAWAGQDNVGVASFDVQVSAAQVPGIAQQSRGPSEVPGTWLTGDRPQQEWQDWLRETPATAADYPAQPAGVLQFRARARDLAGNVGVWSTPQTVTVGGALQFLPLVSSWNAASGG
jgi:hypothetical protein